MEELRKVGPKILERLSRVSDAYRIVFELPYNNIEVHLATIPLIRITIFLGTNCTNCKVLVDTRFSYTEADYVLKRVEEVINELKDICRIDRDE